MVGSRMAPMRQKKEDQVVLRVMGIKRGQFYSKFLLSQL